MSGCDATEICFFGVETSSDENQIMEFACINICRVGLYKLSEYSTLIKPSKGAVSKRDKEYYGITGNMTSNAPSFADVADQIYKHMNNKIWAGHNIIEHDIECINIAFELLNKSPPHHAGVIDTLPLVQEVFLNRAGSNSLESLCEHFGLGLQRHRALADCQQNLEAIKSVACLLLFENKFPHLYVKKVEHFSTMSTSSNVMFRQASSLFSDDQQRLVRLIDDKVRRAVFDYSSQSGGNNRHVVSNPRWMNRRNYLFKGAASDGTELKFIIGKVLKKIE